MRRNRQKLHRSLREHAEARKAAARAVAVRKAADRERFETASRPVAPTVGRYAAQWPGIERLLKLAPVDAPTTSKVSRVCKMLEDLLPELVTVHQLPWLLLISLPPWVRPVEKFRSPGGSARRKRLALAVHLFGEYPIPAFLLRALDATEPLPVARVPVEDRWAVEVLAHVGRGGSLRDLVGTDALPVPMTRRMCHAFLGASADVSPILALRRAQVAGLGGPEALADRLVATRLGALHGPDELAGEPFFQAVVSWLCRRPGLHRASSAVLDDLLGWAIEERRRIGVAWSLEGRTEDSAIRDMRLWRAARGADPSRLADPGIPAFRCGEWAVIPITTQRELVEEGQAMRHCVSMYTGLVQRHKVAIFSLRKDDRRVGTLEVSLGAGAVVQAKGLANRSLTSEEAAVVQLWAAESRLRLRV